MAHTISIHVNTSGSVTLRLYHHDREVERETNEFHMVGHVIDLWEERYSLTGYTRISDWTGHGEMYSLNQFNTDIRTRFI